MAPVWEKYEVRYRSRPETFHAYVDVWKRFPEMHGEFPGWIGFSQAANEEKAQDSQRVARAKHHMWAGGYEIGTPTERGARRWRKCTVGAPIVTDAVGDEKRDFTPWVAAVVVIATVARVVGGLSRLIRRRRS
jgi:hypothetical protein